MTSRTRLSLSIVALVGVVALLLSGFSLYTLAEARFQETYEIARVTAEQVKSHVVQRVSDRAFVEPGTSVVQAHEAWRNAVKEDPQLVSYLVSSIAGSRSVVEILITGERDLVLATSNTARLENTFAGLPDLEDWIRRPVWDKLRQVLAPARDLELRVPLGAGGSPDPVFTIRVVVSTALIRDAVIPQVRNLAIGGFLSLLLAAALAGVLSRYATRPLERISEMVDRIADSDSASTLRAAPPDPELSSLQSKLALLGEQVRGASRDANQLRGNVERMLEQLQDAVFLFEPGNKLVLASKAAERFLDLGRWEVIGQPLEDVFPDSTSLGALVQSAVRLGQPLRDHLITIDRADGTRMHVLLAVELLQDIPDRRRLGVIVNLQDVETRRQLESQLDASYRREAFGKLLQGVAHEIKNPLNSIYTHLQMLQLQLGDGPPEIQAEMEVISREIKTLDRMVVTLLDFTRPLELTLAETDLVGLAQEIVGLLRPRAAEKGIEVELQHHAPVVDIQADRAFLRQAVMNVAVNAIECMKAAGRVRIGVETDGESARLTIADEGPGIPEEARDKVFHLYFTTKGERGSGIGLAMAYRIAQLHRATLDFTTETGGGTTFRFEFQRAMKR
jgi:PAS domain S-box-containing protein